MKMPVGSLPIPSSFVLAVLITVDKYPECTVPEITLVLGRNPDEPTKGALNKPILARTIISLRRLTSSGYIKKLPPKEIDELLSTDSDGQQKNRYTITTKGKEALKAMKPIIDAISHSNWCQYASG